MEKQGEFLRIVDRLTTYEMDNSQEMLANIKKHILGDLRVIRVSYRIMGPTSKLPDLIK